MGRKKQISDQRRLYTERMRLQKGVFSSLANAAGHIGELYADFVQSDEVRNSMRATADKVTECMDGIRELNELEGQLETEKQESEDKFNGESSSSDWCKNISDFRSGRK